MLESVAQSLHYDFSLLIESEDGFAGVVSVAAETEPSQVQEALSVEVLVLDRRVSCGTVGGIESFVGEAEYNRLRGVRGLPEREVLAPGEVGLVAQTGAAPEAVLGRDLVLRDESVGLSITQFVPMCLFSWVRFSAYTAVVVGSKSTGGCRIAS